MTEKTLVLGGARSGKSAYALELARGFLKNESGTWERGLYIATAQALDGEMSKRIQAHREERGDAWHTLEEPFDLAGALRACQGRHPVILIDCLTLWLSNLLGKDQDPFEEWIRPFYKTLEACETPVIMVSNEVGMGVVPPEPLGRSFRDLAGRVHQDLAAACNRVVLVVAGLPMVLKGT